MTLLLRIWPSPQAIPNTLTLDPITLTHKSNAKLKSLFQLCWKFSKNVLHENFVFFRHTALKWNELITEIRTPHLQVFVIFFFSFFFFRRNKLEIWCDEKQMVHIIFCCTFFLSECSRYYSEICTERTETKLNLSPIVTQKPYRPDISRSFCQDNLRS